MTTPSSPIDRLTARVQERMKTAQEKGHRTHREQLEYIARYAISAALLEERERILLKVVDKLTLAITPDDTNTVTAEDLRRWVRNALDRLIQENEEGKL